MSHEDLEGESPNWDPLLRSVLAISAGPEHADEYHRNIEALLSALFYPHLVNPRREYKIHEGRKRIDIAYTNAASYGFFYWLGQHYPAAHVLVECKNYSRPLGNPEYDQVSGRFSPSRGKIGLLLYRGYMDKEQTWRSCLDTAHDSRGYVIPLEDEDLTKLIEEKKEPAGPREFGYLHNMFLRLIND
jgi:hypothetical protein